MSLPKWAIIWSNYFFEGFKFHEWSASAKFVDLENNQLYNTQFVATHTNPVHLRC